MNIVCIAKFARHAAGPHAKDIETYTLDRFMDDLHDDEQSGASEADRGAELDSESVDE